MAPLTDTRPPAARAADREAALRESALGLQAKVDFLASPAAYPERPARVEARETHMSWVFLTDGMAYKLKKPVVYPYLDFSTLSAREARCRDEVRLNRRLAPDVYLGVARLTREADGRLAPAELDAQRYVELLRAQHDANAGLLLRPDFALDGLRVARIVEAIERFFDAGRALLEARAAGGHVVEGHGDLRPEHVFLLDAPVIIDCLEFNRALRLVDPFDEIGFLGLECERLGAPWVGQRPRRDLQANSATASTIPCSTSTWRCAPACARCGSLAASRCAKVPRTRRAHASAGSRVSVQRSSAYAGAIARAAARSASQRSISASTIGSRAAKSNGSS